MQKEFRYLILLQIVLFLALYSKSLWASDFNMPNCFTPHIARIAPAKVVELCVRNATSQEVQFTGNLVLPCREGTRALFKRSYHLKIIDGKIALGFPIVLVGKDEWKPAAFFSFLEQQRKHYQKWMNHHGLIFNFEFSILIQDAGPELLRKGSSPENNFILIDGASESLSFNQWFWHQRGETREILLDNQKAPSLLLHELMHWTGFLDEYMNEDQICPLLTGAAGIYNNRQVIFNPHNTKSHATNAMQDHPLDLFQGALAVDSLYMTIKPLCPNLCNLSETQDLIDKEKLRESSSKQDPNFFYDYLLKTKALGINKNELAPQPQE